MNLTVPAGLSGDYYLIAKIDSTGAIADIDPSNNIIVSGDIDIQNVVTACVNELFNDLGQNPAAAVGPLSMVNQEHGSANYCRIRRSASMTSRSSVR